MSEASGTEWKSGYNIYVPLFDAVKATKISTFVHDLQRENEKESILFWYEKFGVDSFFIWKTRNVDAA